MPSSLHLNGFFPLLKAENILWGELCALHTLMEFVSLPRMSLDIVIINKMSLPNA